MADILPGPTTRFPPGRHREPTTVPTPPPAARPQLTRRETRSPRGLVLMLHGGAEMGLQALDHRSRPWLRSRLMMAQLEGAFRRAGLHVWLLRHRYSGWNLGVEPQPSPVVDGRWALDRVREEHGALRVVLLGHSMGARTAAAVADDPSVTGVVALAPWFPPGEPVTPLRGRSLVAAHARADRVTSYAATADFVRRAEGTATRAELVDMGPGHPLLGHYLLDGVRAWNRVARERTLQLAQTD